MPCLCGGRRAQDEARRGCGMAWHVVSLRRSSSHKGKLELSSYSQERYLPQTASEDPKRVPPVSAWRRWMCRQTGRQDGEGRVFR